MRLGFQPEEFADPNVSHELHSLVFSGSADDELFAHLYAARRGTWTIRRLPAAFDDISRPVWSPSFDHVADESGTVLKADGTVRRELDVYLRPGFPWSADGTEMVYSKDAYEEGDIFVVSLTGSKARPIAQGSLPSWAPDGRVYSSVVRR